MLVHRVTEELVRHLMRSSTLACSSWVVGALGTFVVRDFASLHLPRVLVGRIPALLLQVADALGQRGLMFLEGMLTMVLTEQPEA